MKSSQAYQDYIMLGPVDNDEALFTLGHDALLEAQKDVISLEVYGCFYSGLSFVELTRMIDSAAETIVKNVERGVA